VTTSKGINGIRAVPREHLLVADKPQGFAEAVSQLLNDQILSKRLGENARKFAMIKHDWPTHMKKLEALLHRDQ
jgi:glycosyltransferase involved in cell wall biosynthesis